MKVRVPRFVLVKSLGPVVEFEPLERFLYHHVFQVLSVVTSITQPLPLAVSQLKVGV